MLPSYSEEAGGREEVRITGGPVGERRPLARQPHQPEAQVALGACFVLIGP